MTYRVGYSDLQSRGITDSDGNLTAKYDAATVNWGGKWHTPTLAQIQELIDECEWTWTTTGGVNGYEVKSKSNGKSIFVPAAGYRFGTSLRYAGSYGSFWSSTASEGNSDVAFSLNFNSGYYFWDDWGVRIFGQSVRPVAE